MTVNLFDPESRLRPTSWSGLLVVATSIVCSIVGRGVLGARVRIRWSVGTFYGPEYAPTALVLGAFPVALAALYVGSRWLAGRLERVDGFDGARDVYELSVLATLLAFVLTQAVLVAANLV